MACRKDQPPGRRQRRRRHAPSKGTATIGGRLYADQPAPLHEVGALLEAKAIHTGRTARNHLLALAATTGIGRRLLENFAGRLPDLEPGPGPDHRLERLTEREREVLGEVALGLTNLEIASELFLSEATVKTHVGRILAKLELRDRVQAVIFAYETRLIRPS